MQEKPKRKSSAEAFQSNARELLEMIRKKNPHLKWEEIAIILQVKVTTLNGYIYHGKIPEPYIMLKMAQLANNNGLWFEIGGTGKVIFSPEKANVDI